MTTSHLFTAGPKRDPLNARRLSEALSARTAWNPIVVTEETASTNDDLRQAALAGAPDRTVHTTHFQSAGKGRLGRVFTMAPGSGIAVSALLRSDADIARWTWLPLVAGLAVWRTIGGYGLDAGLKWPNDVLIGAERKICGILVERVETPTGPAAVIGCGINVSLTQQERAADHVTSLTMEGVSRDRHEVIVDLLINLEAELDRWSRNDPAQRSDYEAASITLGQMVKLTGQDGAETVGIAEAIDNFGQVVIDGTAYSAGDVTRLRPV